VSRHEVAAHTKKEAKKKKKKKKKKKQKKQNAGHLEDHAVPGKDSSP
jgi:hypothetical protein